MLKHTEGDQKERVKKVHVLKTNRAAKHMKHLSAGAYILVVEIYSAVISHILVHHRPVKNKGH